MKKLACSLFALCYFCNLAISQIYYTPPNVSPTIPVGCDVFSGNPKQNGYTHYGELGGVGYTSTSSNGIVLPFSMVNYTDYGTGYTIAFPFTLGQAYTIKVTAFSSFSGSTYAPDLWFSASTGRYTASPSCSQVVQNTTLANLFSPPTQNNPGIGVSTYSTTSISSSTSQSYTILSNYYPTPGLNYINIGTQVPLIVLGPTYAGNIDIQEISWTAVSPPTTPEINGSSSFYFTSTKTQGLGTITGTPGATVTIILGSGGPPPGNYTVYFTSGVAFTDGTYTFNVTNGSAWKQVVVPSSGSISWNGTFSEANQYGSGSISVY